MNREKMPEIEKVEVEKIERRVKREGGAAAERQSQACCAGHGGGSSFS